MDIIESFLSESETAEVLGVKTASLRNWSASRKGPPRIKIGRKIFYRREALVAWKFSPVRRSPRTCAVSDPKG